MERALWDVDYLVSIVAGVLVQTVAAKLKEGLLVDWADAVTVRQWLTDVKDVAEKRLEDVGFVRGLASSGRVHEEWKASSPDSSTYHRREGMRAAEHGEPRERQLAQILERAKELDSFNLPPDPGHLAPFSHPILDESFLHWFRSLAPGTDIVYAANALGRSQEKSDSARANQLALGVWRSTHEVPVYVDTIAIQKKNLREALDNTAHQKAIIIEEISISWRKGLCYTCGESVIGHHNGAYHSCNGDERVEITGNNFSSLERILHPHDILHDADFVDVLGSIDDVLVELDMQSVPVQRIVESAFRQKGPQGLVEACGSRRLPRDPDHLLTIAFDIVLSESSTCLAQFLPINFDDRLAWSRDQSQLLTKWFRGETKLYMAVCYGLDPSTPNQHFFLSDNDASAKHAAPRNASNAYSSPSIRFSTCLRIIGIDEIRPRTPSEPVSRSVLCLIDLLARPEKDAALTALSLGTEPRGAGSSHNTDPRRARTLFARPPTSFFMALITLAPARPPLSSTDLTHPSVSLSPSSPTFYFIPGALSFCNADYARLSAIFYPVFTLLGIVYDITHPGLSFPFLSFSLPRRVSPASATISSILRFHPP
ncbi:hypothetical protein C8J57DRAFT_1551331 [Mycena rebaudengoi]|nr:hypothetical protein C8J57DRAFT_1551331 [Mycena rebaudengoi]